MIANHESRITVVTSCSAAGWEQYGRRCVETFMKHWPRTAALQVHSEDLHRAQMIGILGREGGRDLCFHQQLADAGYRAYFERHANNPRAHGRVQERGQLWPAKALASGQNWRYDAYRFAHKVFAIHAAARALAGGRLYWVDADSVTFAPVPIELLERLLPGDVALSYLDRGDYPSECGFVGYNLDHPAARPFIEAFADLYLSDRVFAEVPEWHDSYVFDWLRKRQNLPAYQIPYAAGQRRHPFVNSELGRYVDHLKGPRKAAGKTPRHELAANLDVPYWRGAA